MKFTIFSELSYEVFSSTTFIFNIQAANLPNQQIIEESLFISPEINFTPFQLNTREARFIKMEVAQGIFFTIFYNATVDVNHTVLDERKLLQATPIIELDAEILPYLFPSRHCQADKLRNLAIKLFGHLTDTYSKAVAISDWIFYNIDYRTGTTDSGTSAYDTLVQREGVCKDFAHLGIALCRALDIPARYFTGYACYLNPPDFHACFEAYIGGQWIFFDPTKSVPINGLVKIANGKDATEAAVASFFGHTNCTYMNVQCNPADETFVPHFAMTDKIEALSYE